jgi:hypothetical protein
MRRLHLAAAVVLAASSAAWAQFDPTLVPDRPAQPAPAAAPSVQQAPLDDVQPEDNGQLPAQGVYQQGLDTLDPSSPGILTAASGGFPGTMWQGSDRRALVALLPRMPIGKGSPAMRSLAERLLLSEAQVPAGSSKNVYDVFQARIDRLAAAGYGAEIADLFGRVPEKIADTRLTHVRVDVLLLTANPSAACDEALSANQRSEEPSWLEVVGYCKLVKGDPDGASFTADMLRETGVDDADYFALLSWLSLPEEARGEKPALKNDKPLTPLRLVMLKATGNEVTVETLDLASPLVLVAVANDKDLPSEIKLEAAERAARAGAIGAGDLAAAYAGVTLNAPDLADPVTAAASQPGGKGNALLYQAAMQAADPVSKLKILQAIWARAQADGAYLLAAKVNAEAAKALLPPPLAVAEESAALAMASPAPSERAPIDLLPDAPPAPLPEPESVLPPPELVAAAPEIIRALLAAGDVVGARNWYGVVQEGAAAGDAKATFTQAQLWPLLVVADPETQFSEDAFDGWWQGQSQLGGADRSRRGALLMAVLEGLGQPVPQAFWGGLYDGADQADGAVPPLPVWRGLNAAGEAGRLGESVLLSLVVLGDGGPAKVSPAVLGDVLKTLAKVGLDRDARALATEALILSGF